MIDMKSYEGMFVMSGAGTDFQAASEPVRNILARNGAETLMLKAWDERRMTYSIRGNKRGLYILTFFKADPLKISEVEHDCRLDERFLRVLILRRDRLTQEEIDAEAASTVKPPMAFDPEARAAESEADLARFIRGGRGYGGGRGFGGRQGDEDRPIGRAETVAEEAPPKEEED
jgi:small subunit ribosomal protein S6